MNKTIIIIFAIFLLSGCIQKQSNNLLKDEYSLSAFNKKAVKEIESLILFLDEQLLEKSNINNVALGYSDFSTELFETTSLIEQKNISVISQEELENLISNLSKETFSEIWVYEYGYDYLTKDTLSVFLNINLDGKYMNFLNQISSENDELEEYVKTIFEDGYIGPSLNGYFPSLALSLNFEIPRYRLLFAIHYYTMIYEKNYK